LVTTFEPIEVALPTDVIGPVRFAFVVTVEAFPFNAPLNVVAVMVPALKFPDASRATIAEAVLTEVDVVAELGILVSEAPEPLNIVDDNVPVDGLNNNLELEDFSA